jgi:PhnB protein
MAENENSVSAVRQTVVPHLVVKGASDAIDFYVKAFGAREMFRLPTPDGRLMHATLGFGNSLIHLCDEFPEHRCAIAPLSLGGTAVTIHLNVDDVDATYAQALAAGAKEVMPPTDMFWGDRYGQVVDPFGHRWSVSTPLESVAPDQVAERMKLAVPQPA